MPIESNQPGTPPPSPVDGQRADDPSNGNGSANGNTGAKPPGEEHLERKPAPPQAVAHTPAGPGAGHSATKATPALSRDRPMAWLILIALIAVSALPVYYNLNHAGSMYVTQARALPLAAETWRHRYEMYNGDVTLESLVPVLDGQPQLDQPPGIVWLDQLAFASLDPATATDEDLAYHMRLLTAVFGLLTVAAVFWAGFSVGGLATASFSALVFLACPVWVFYARAGTLDMPSVALETLAVASAMWALRPLRPSPSVPRQAVGWVVCGVALGAAVLTGGPAAIPAVLAPIFVFSVMCPNRISHLLGLVASVFIAALAVMPWVQHVHGQDPQVWRQWVSILWPNSMSSPGAFGQAVSDRGMLLPLLVLPWTFWLIGSLAQPFSASSSGVRRRVLIGWAWFVCLMFLVLTGPGPDGLAGLLPALPAAAILIGQCLRLFSDLSAEARHARIWRLTRWPHLALLAAASVALPAGMYFQSALVQRNILSRLIVAPMTWYFWLGLGVSLLLITALSMRFALRHYPGKTLVCWAVWAVVLMNVMLIPLTRGPLMHPDPGTQAPAHGKAPGAAAGNTPKIGPGEVPGKVPGEVPGDVPGGQPGMMPDGP
jgi:4-amino-4-deoxy-L-arabinose transferase-like glycosyltransferase